MNDKEIMRGLIGLALISFGGAMLCGGSRGKREKVQEPKEHYCKCGSVLVQHPEDLWEWICPTCDFPKPKEEPERYLGRLLSMREELCCMIDEVDDIIRSIERRLEA